MGKLFDHKNIVKYPLRPKKRLFNFGNEVEFYWLFLSVSIYMSDNFKQF